VELERIESVNSLAALDFETQARLMRVAKIVYDAEGKSPYLTECQFFP